MLHLPACHVGLLTCNFQASHLLRPLSAPSSFGNRRHICWPLGIYSFHLPCKQQIPDPSNISTCYGPSRFLEVPCGSCLASNISWLSGIWCDLPQMMLINTDIAPENFREYNSRWSIPHQPTFASGVLIGHDHQGAIAQTFGIHLVTEAMSHFHDERTPVDIETPIFAAKVSGISNWYKFLPSTALRLFNLTILSSWPPINSWKLFFSVWLRNIHQSLSANGLLLPKLQYRENLYWTVTRGLVMTCEAFTKLSTLLSIGRSIHRCPPPPPKKKVDSR